MRFAALLLACAGCALPAVTAGTFLPAGDLKPGDLHASASLEVGRVLAGPADVHDLTATPPDARQYDVSTWFASDLSLRWMATSRISLEGQLKLTDAVSPLTPALAGGALGVRVRLKDRSPEGGLALELAARAVGVSVQQTITRTAGSRSQVDTWDYRSLGLELPLVVTYRVNSLFAVTGAPFVRAYWIRAWHDEHTTTVASDGTSTVTFDQAALQWTPVLSAGIGGSLALDLGPLQIAPGLALELATRPGPNTPTHLLFEPGLSVGTRF